jgi:hypothetical protein
MEYEQKIEKDERTTIIIHDEPVLADQVKLWKKGMKSTKQ